MPLHEPPWWYGPKGDWRARLLTPAGDLYGWMAERRFRDTEPYRPAMPVICVGNFTAGGTGKSPLSMLVAELLMAQGETPAFLTRGYGGKVRGPAWVDTANPDAAAFGDEPLLLARLAPVMVSADRAAGARAIEARLPAISVIVMDDGLQNPALAKDLSFAVVDGARGVGNGEVIPAGPLRAALEFQLGLVDAIVVNGGVTGEGVHERLRTGFPGPVLAANVRPVGDVGWLAGAKVAAYAGIGNPQRFFALLRELGAEVTAARAFPDHHRFTSSDATSLMDDAIASNATLVTTEKDLARLAGAGEPQRQLRERSRTLPVRLGFEERDRMRIEELLAGLRKRGAAQP